MASQPRRVKAASPGGWARRRSRGARLVRVVAGEVHDQEHEEEREPGDDERADSRAEDPVVHLAGQRVVVVRFRPHVVADPQGVDDGEQVQPRPRGARPPHCVTGGGWTVTAPVGGITCPDDATPFCGCGTGGFLSAATSITPPSAGRGGCGARYPAAVAMTARVAGLNPAGHAAAYMVAL